MKCTHYKYIVPSESIDSLFISHCQKGKKKKSTVFFRGAGGWGFDFILLEEDMNPIFIYMNISSLKFEGHCI